MAAEQACKKTKLSTTVTDARTAALFGEHTASVLNANNIVAYELDGIVYFSGYKGTWNSAVVAALNQTTGPVEKINVSGDITVTVDKMLPARTTYARMRTTSISKYNAATNKWHLRKVSANCDYRNLTFELYFVEPSTGWFEQSSQPIPLFSEVQRLVLVNARDQFFHSEQEFGRLEHLTFVHSAPTCANIRLRERYVKIYFVFEPSFWTVSAWSTWDNYKSSVRHISEDEKQQSEMIRCHGAHGRDASFVVIELENTAKYLVDRTAK